MSDPVTEQIASAVATVIEGVTEDNGAQLTISSVVRPTRIGGFKPAHLLVVLMQDDWRDAGNAPMGKVRRVLPLSAYVFVRASDRDETPADTYCNLAEAEIEKAIQTAMGTDRLGGLAKHIEFTEPESFVFKDGAFEGKAINFEVTYGHAYNDPFTPA